MSEALQGFTNRFIGFEIVEHGKDYVKIKDMSPPTSKEFENSLKRIFFLIKQMATDILEAVKRNDMKILEDMHDIDINLDKFHDYCARVLNKNGNPQEKRTSLLLSTIFFIELIGDEFKNIANHLIKDFPRAKLKKIERITENVKESLDLYENIFYEFSKEKIKKISRLDQEMYVLAPELYRKSGEEEKEVLHHLRVVRRYLNALLELRIEMEF